MPTTAEGQEVAVGLAKAMAVGVGPEPPPVRFAPAVTVVTVPVSHVKYCSPHVADMPRHDDGAVVGAGEARVTVSVGSAPEMVMLLLPLSPVSRPVLRTNPGNNAPAAIVAPESVPAVPLGTMIDATLM